MKLESRKGFTLIEVLLVLAMVALLTTLAIPKLIGIYEEAEKAKAKADAQIIVAAILREELRYELQGESSGEKWTSKLVENNNENGYKEIGEEALEELQIKLHPKNYKFYYYKDTTEKRYISIIKEGLNSPEADTDSFLIDN